MKTCGECVSHVTRRLQNDMRASVSWDETHNPQATGKPPRRP